jgi:hypothetical protein
MNADIIGKKERGFGQSVLNTRLKTLIDCPKTLFIKNNSSTNIACQGHGVFNWSRGKSISLSSKIRILTY